MTALAAAFFTAALALVGKIIFDIWSRHRKKRGIAASLAGEIGAYVELLQPEMLVSNFRKIAEMEYSHRGRQLAAFGSPPSSHPVFDKVADKIGLLSTSLARDISKFYNVVTGIRLLISNMSSDGFKSLSDDVQVSMIEEVIKMIEKHIIPATTMVDQLDRTARQNLGCVHCSCSLNSSTK